MRLDFEAMFSAYVAGTTKSWEHDRSKTLGASEVFGCLRKAWFKKRAIEFTERIQIGMDTVEDGVDVIDGIEYPRFVETPTYADVDRYPPDEDTEESWGAMRRGDILEAHFVVPAIRDNLPKGKLIFGGNDQKTFIEGYNSATPDGIIIGIDRDALANYGVPDIGTSCIMFEIKSIDPRVTLKEEKAIHHGQTQQQMGLVREKTPYKPNFAVILYVDASFLDKIKVFVVEFDEESWAAAKHRANEVYTTDDPAKIMPEGRLDGECAFCIFTKSCAIVTNGTIPDDNSKLIAKDEELLVEFDPLAAEYQECQRAAKEAEKAFEQVKMKVKTELALIGSRKIGGKKMRRLYSFSWSPRAGQKRLSTALLQEALGEDLDAFKAEGNPFDVLTAKFADEADGAEKIDAVSLD